MTEIAALIAEKGDLAHLVLFLWASAASGLCAWAVKELIACNRRFNSFVADIARLTRE